jgi:hypothetical protein
MAERNHTVKARSADAEIFAPTRPPTAAPPPMPTSAARRASARLRTPSRRAAGAASPSPAAPAANGAATPAAAATAGGNGTPPTGALPALPPLPASRPLPPELKASRDAAAADTLTENGLQHWTKALLSNNWLHLEQFTLSRQCAELSGLGPLSTQEEADAKKAIGILRRRAGADHGLPDDDDIAVLELRELSRAYVAAAKAPPQPKRGRDDEDPDKEKKEIKKSKYDEKVRDDLLANVALACGETELDEAEMPAREALEACWAAARSNPPDMVPYKATKFAVRMRLEPAPALHLTPTSHP